MNRDVSVAWGAGIFEGEGCIHFVQKRSIKVTVSMTDLDVLEMMQEIFGGGITPLKKRQDHWKESWIWSLHGEKARDFLLEVKPFLMSRRSQKADEALARYSQIEEEAERHVKLRKEILDLYATGLYTETEVGNLTGTNRAYVNAVRQGKLKLNNGI